MAKALHKLNTLFLAGRIQMLKKIDLHVAAVSDKLHVGKIAHLVRACSFDAMRPDLA
jgi:hypothetical protein